MKILIVEDDKISGKLLQSVLGSEGFGTEIAGDGQEALLLLNFRKFDCIVSDIMMPDIDGYRLIYKIRRDKALREIPFIMYSAYALSPADQEFAIRLGVNRYVKKEGNAREIVNAIYEVLKHPAAEPSDGNGHSYNDQWVMEKYSSLLADKLEDKIGELGLIKKELDYAMRKEKVGRIKIEQLNGRLEEKEKKAAPQ